MSIKAFELVPAIERLNLMYEKTRSQVSGALQLAKLSPKSMSDKGVECIECCGKNLYIGTSDCFVIHYKVEERMVNGRASFSSEKLGHKFLGLKKPVVQLKAASALNRILVLCDNNLTLLNMFDLEPVVSGAKVKAVASFSLNSNPENSNPFSVEICVALRKKQLHIYNVTEDRLQLTKSVDVPELPIITAIDANFICVAMTTQYMIINFESGHRQELFPYSADQIRPFVTFISKGEFLLSAPYALGMFAASGGISQRPPLQWSDNLVSVIYSHPYVLALNDEFITVHSILDQQQKQSIPFQGGQWLGEFDGRIFVASFKEIYALVPVAMEKQIQALLADKRVTEGLALARNARKIGLNKEQYRKMYLRIQQQAGFIEFTALHFDEAQELFKNGGLDVRELITLYPHMMPSNTSFMRSVPPLHEIADINQLSRGDPDKVWQYKEFLLAYLEEVRGSHTGVTHRKEVDTALMKLYIEQNSPELIPLIVTESSVDVVDCIPWLERFHRHHALALLHRSHGDNDKALNVWTRICSGELQDDLFPGLEFIVEILANLADHEIVWKYVEWVLEKDEKLGVKVFSERPENEDLSERMKPDLIVDYLHRFPQAVIVYLEYLVFSKKLQKESYHTHLAVLYLDRVLHLRKEDGSDHKELDKARAELRHLLQSSSLYRVALLLGKIKETDMHVEAAILYGKLEEHDKALRILVHKLRDFEAAEQYCRVNSAGKDLVTRQRLFQTLLAVYLDPNNGKRDLLVAPAVSLLNNNQNDFDTIKVLQTLPSNWSIGLLNQFLTSSVRKSMNHTRTTRLERMLARGENLAVKGENIKLCRNLVALGEESSKSSEQSCAVCNRPFSEAVFVRYPNGVLAHTHCAKNKNVCPVTGKLFSTTQPPTKK